MSEWFPERQITPQESEHLLSYCGGVPPVPEYLDFFLSTTESSAFNGATKLKSILRAVGVSCAESLDVPVKQGSEVFAKGAIFYAGVLQFLQPNSPGVPYEEEALHSLAQLDERAFKWVVSERLQDELPSYCKLLDQTAPALSLQTDKERNLALIGSGMVHSIALDSMHLREEIRQLEQDFKL